MPSVVALQEATERAPNTSRAGSVANLGLTGLAIALWTAALHLLIVVVVRALQSEMYWHWTGRDVWWIVPLGYLLLFAIPIVVLVLLNAAAPGVARRHWVFGLWSFLGLFCVFLLYTRAHSWALALLAAGSGAQLARLYRRHEDQVAQVLRRGALGFAAFFLLFGGGATVLRAWKIQRAFAGLPPGADEAPNVLLILLDTVRAGSMSLYGAVRPTTPRLEAWAKRGVTFQHAFATSSWTLPSHASIFTGRYASQHSADWTSPLDRAHRTVAEVFQAHGYATGGFTANQNAASYETGIGRGFITYEDTKRSLAEVLANTTITQGDVVVNAMMLYRRSRSLSAAARQFTRFDFRPGAWGTIHDHKTAGEVVAQFLRWQSSLGERPFFAFLNLFDAHAPERTPAEYRLMFARDGAKRRDVYDGTLRYLDDRVAALLEELGRRGVLRNTIVIITADHGEHFGEHGLNGHGNSLYRELLAVPLVIIGGDSAAAGRRIEGQVSLRDVAATSLDLAGLPPSLPGRSLATHWRSDSSGSSPVVAEVSKGIRDNPKHPTAKGDMAAAIDDSLHMIRNGDGSLEVYAYRTDTTEAQNLAIGSIIPALRARFSSLHQRALRSPE